MRNTAAVIYVIQPSNDPTLNYFAESAEEFNLLMNENDLMNVPVLLLVQSFDNSEIDKACHVATVSEQFKLEKLTNRQWKIQFVPSKS